MSLKTLIFFGLMAVALGSTLPVKISYDTDDSEWIYGEGEGDVVPVADDVVFVRKARSPQGSLIGAFQHNRRDGSSASIDYNHQMRKNLEIYGGGSRNFKFNDNSVHAGLRYRF